MLVRALIGICLVAMGASLATAADDDFNPAWHVIFPAEKAANLSHNGPATIASTWLPSDAEIAALEPLLAVQLKAELARDARGRTMRVGDFYRQYGGIVEGGQKLIVANGFHKSYVERRRKKGDFWKQEAVFVMDGGCNYFHAAYDVERRQFAYVFCQGAG